MYGHPSAGLLWERQFEKILVKHGWEKVSNWECLFVHREKGLFLSVIFPGSRISKDIVDNYRTMFESRISAERIEKLPFPQNLRISSWSYDMLVMQRNVWNDIVSWQTRRLNNSTKYLLHASMTTTSKKKKQNLLENCQIHALKLYGKLILGTNWTTWSVE